MLSQYKRKQLTPINILTLVVCLIQHLEIGRGIFYEVMMIWNGDDQTNIAVYWFSMINFMMLVFMWCYSVMGGLGIAVYRIMLIKYHNVVYTIIGQKLLMYIILLCEFLIILFLFAVLEIANSLFFGPLRPPFYDTARISSLDSLEVLDVYNQASGNPSFFDIHIMIKASVFVFLILLTLVEIAIYFVFFRHLYKHDNKEIFIKLLGTKAIHERNAKNAMSFISLFLSFTVEITCLILITYFWFASDRFLIPIVFRKFTLSVVAIVEVITSKNLR